MMQSATWLALAGDAPLQVQDPALRTGALTLALRGLPRLATVLADARVMIGGLACSAAVIAGQDVGVVLRLRAADRTVLRHVLAADLHSHAGAAEVTFSWIGGGDVSPAGRWRLSVCQGDGRLLAAPVFGNGALALPVALGQALIRACEGSPFVQAAGLRRAAPGRPGPEQTGRGAAIAASALLQTPAGRVPAAALMSGDAVVDISGRELRLAQMQLDEIPGGFAFSPLALDQPEGAPLLIGPQAWVSAPGFLQPVTELPGIRRYEGAARAVRMAVPVPDRPAFLAIGGVWLACADPDGRLPQPVAALGGHRRAV